MTTSPAFEGVRQATPGGRAEIGLAVSGMETREQARAVELALETLPGVRAHAHVDNGQSAVHVTFDRSHCAVVDLMREMERIGVRITGPAKSGMRADSWLMRLQRGARAYPEMMWGIIGGVMLLAGWWVHAAGGPQWIRLPLVIGSMLLCGWGTAIDTFKVLFKFKFDIDVLMFAAAIGAVSLGQFEEGALLLFLFAMGGAGELMAMDKARKAINALAKLAPETATVRDDDGRERMVRVEELTVGQHVVIRPFDRVPADAVVETGDSAVDQSPITGESVPVERGPGDPVLAGTLNGQGLLVAKVSRPAGESALAKIVKLVKEAQASKSPTQIFTERVEKWYVPAVLLGTAAVMVLPVVLGGGAWAVWFYRSMAFLTGASPCALAIGTPAAVLSGIARAARLGVLVKGGAHLENLGRVGAVAMDKTGTLTVGRPTVTDVVALAGWEEKAVLESAAALERGSSHPLANAIVMAARERGCAELVAEGVGQVPGIGVEGMVSARRVTVGKMPKGDAAGKPAGASESAGKHGAEAVARLGEEGKTTVVVTVDGVIAGVIGLADRPRENAAESVRRLKACGVKRVVMLTGDHAGAAAAVGRIVGVDEVRAGLMPGDKVALVRELGTKYGGVAMIGDGVNDAPAMAAATVGIAMGGAGTDVAIETADVALMADDLAKLPDAIGLGRFSRHIIKQNLIIALGVIGILAPLAALGYAQLGVAVLFHEGSTVVVVLNALRLLAWKPR